jgi:hypothetical protein
VSNDISHVDQQEGQMEQRYAGRQF